MVQVRMNETQFERLTAALNKAIAIAGMHAPTVRDELLAVAADLDDTWNARTLPDDDALIDAVVNAHSLGTRIQEHHALILLSMIGMDGDDADELITAAREEAGQP